MNELKTKIKKLHSKLVDEYDPTIQHFNIGDEAWIMYDDRPVKIIITDIDDYSENGTKPGGYFYYWFQFKDLSKIRKSYEYVKFYIWYYVLSHLRIRQFKIPPEMGPGHGELCGRDEVIFKTREQAILDLKFYKLYDLLKQIEFVAGDYIGAA
jgi:hypothetical protein